MKQNRLQEKTNLLLGKTMVEGFDAQVYIDWAIDLMQEECCLEELDILASLDVKQGREIENYFKLVCEKLNIKLVVYNEEYLKTYLLHLAQRVLDGKIDIGKTQGLFESVWDAYDDSFGGIDAIAYAPDYWSMMELPNGASDDGYEGYLRNEFKIYLENNTKK